MCQPCDGIGLAGSGTMLNEVIEGSMVFVDAGEGFANAIQLMISGENDIFRFLFLSGNGIFFFLALHKDKLMKQFQNGILLQDILPHIGNRITVGVQRIAFACLDAFSITLIKGEEEGAGACQLGRHMDFFQIHGKVYKAASLKLEQPG